MDSTKVLTKISKVSKSLNYISKSNFGYQIEEIMKKETAQKRRRLDRLSNKMIMRKEKGDHKYTDLESKRQNWERFQVS